MIDERRLELLRRRLRERCIDCRGAGCRRCNGTGARLQGTRYERLLLEQTSIQTEK